MKNLFTALIIVITFFTIYPQDTINVPGDYTTIQLGIDAASNGDIVLVEDGTYIENINYRGKAITVASLFLVDGDVNHVSNTVIDGSQPSHPDSGSVVLLESGEDTTSVLCGFTITGGTGTFVLGPPPIRVGGGINCIMSGAKIINCRIEYNTVEYLSGTVSGGGIAVGPPGNNYWLILENDTIRNNTVHGLTGSGGGVADVGNLRCQNNVIEYNVGESIGGIILGGGLSLGNTINPTRLLIIGNTIKFNEAICPSGPGSDGGVGGGLSIIGISDETVIKNNIITHNNIQSNAPVNDCFGGGVFLRDTKETTILSENYIAFNSSLENSICHGAGIAIWSLDGDTSRPRLINNIIRDNTNADYGGGIYISGQSGSGNRPLFFNNTIVNNSGSFGGSVYSKNSHPIFINSILWNNGNEIYTNGGDVLVYYSDVEGGWSGTGLNNINVDPLFVDTMYNLADSSMCIGAGINSIEISGTWYYAPPFDYDGDPRPNPPECMPDIGAQESQLCIPATTISIDPIELYFSGVLVNNDSTMVFTITNTGNMDLEVMNITSTEPAFSVNITTATIPSGGNQDVEVTFTPTSTGPYNGIIEITHSAVGNPDSVNVSGNGITGIDDKLFNTVPGNFIVYQNYPNPFNPKTSIIFGLPEASEVKLTLYNSLGEETANLFKGYKNAGYHHVEFDASKLPSGVYFYRLQAVDPSTGSGRVFVETKKMLLLK